MHKFRNEKGVIFSQSCLFIFKGVWGAKKTVRCLHSPQADLGKSEVLESHIENFHKSPGNILTSLRLLCFRNIFVASDNHSPSKRIISLNGRMNKRDECVPFDGIVYWTFCLKKRHEDALLKRNSLLKRM